MTPVRRLSSLAERGGPLAAACAAGFAALPGLRFPFLSDDWHLIASVHSWPPPATAYEYFRPLYVATFWLDRTLWGASPALFHVTNLLLIAATAALVVVVARRYTGDARLAAVAGLLFAVHPYHVENAAWVAVRGDPLYGALVLLAAWSYDRWRSGGRAAPFASLVLFEAALLAKESAVVLPFVLVLIGFVDRERRPRKREWLLGLAPLFLMVFVHFFVVRRMALSGAGRALVPGTGAGWLKHALGFVVAALVPVDGEVLAARPWPWALLATAAFVTITMAALRRGGSVLRVPAAAFAVFGVLLVPSLIGFQERYLFLPIAAFAVGLASLILSLPRRAAFTVSILLIAGWLAAWYVQWRNWQEAALASRALVAGLVAASREPDTREIVVANMPFRVRGGSVAGDFEQALALCGGRALAVRAVAYVSYPNADEDFLDGPPGVAIRRLPDAAEVRLRVPEAPYSHLVAPRATGSTRRAETPEGTVVFEDHGRLRIDLPARPDRGRAAYVWIGGELERLQ